jgi:4'-phosphopantetheinyl transferase
VTPSPSVRGDIELRPNELHLWLAYYDGLEDPQLLNRYRSLLTHGELGRERKFYFEKDQRRYLVTRALVRTVLSRYCDVAPSRWRFGANAYGRPFVANDEPGAAELSFNISHTDRLIVLGVASSQPLGVDVENVVAERPALDLARHCFSAEECEDVYAQPPRARQNRFLDYWTLKEAYVKARGMGLSIDLNCVRFRLEGKKGLTVSLDPALEEAGCSWRFWLLQPPSEHRIAVCAANGDQELVVRRAVPLLGDEIVNARIVRQSRVAAVGARA